MILCQIFVNKLFCVQQIHQANCFYDKAKLKLCFNIVCLGRQKIEGVI